MQFFSLGFGFATLEMTRHIRVRGFHVGLGVADEMNMGTVYIETCPCYRVNLPRCEPEAQ